MVGVYQYVVGSFAYPNGDMQVTVCALQFTAESSKRRNAKVGRKVIKSFPVFHGTLDCFGIGNSLSVRWNLVTSTDEAMRP
jgi:hypothetical protein